MADQRPLRALARTLVRMGVAGALAVMVVEPASASAFVMERLDDGPPALPSASGDEPSSESSPGSAVPEMVSPAAEAVTLTWKVPPQCPEIEAVRRSLAGYLGEGPTAEAGASVEAIAEVTQDESGFRLSLRTRTGSGVTTKETTAEDCGVLADATALIVAIAVDPSTVLGRMEAETAEPVEPEPEPVEPEPEPEPELSPVPAEPEPSPAPDPEPSPAPESPSVRFGMRVGGGIDAGVLPGPAGGLRLAGAVLRPRWRVELRGDYWFARTSIAEEGIGARVAAWSAGVRGCGVPGIERLSLEFPLCGGMEAGALRGDPVGDRVDAPDPSRQPWVAADASAGLAWAPRRFLAVFIQGELVVPIVRSGFRVGTVEIHRAGPVSGRALVGLEARFP